MERSKDHATVAALTLSGTKIDVGEYDSRASEKVSIWLQTEADPEPVYIKVAEARLLVAALEAAIDHITKGD